MEKKETAKFLERIKEHYQEFIFDNAKLEEWHSFLKDYSYQDVSKEFEKHLNNEQWGHLIPKVAFLTKYLVKEEDKGKVENHRIQCYICGRYFRQNEYDEHFKRCSSINYMNNQYFKYYGKLLDRKPLYEMEEEEFRKLYRKMLEVVRDNTKDEYEKERVTALLEYRPFIIQGKMFNE